MYSDIFIAYSLFLAFLSVFLVLQAKRTLLNPHPSFLSFALFLIVFPFPKNHNPPCLSTTTFKKCNFFLLHYFSLLPYFPLTFYPRILKKNKNKRISPPSIGSHTQKNVHIPSIFLLPKQPSLFPNLFF